MKLDDLPPLPFTYETHSLSGSREGTGYVYVLDAKGRKIASLWGHPAEKIAVAEMICDASETIAKGHAT